MDDATGDGRLFEQAGQDGARVGGGVGAHVGCSRNERAFETPRV
jgi:hypothetical protein